MLFFGMVWCRRVNVFVYLYFLHNNKGDQDSGSQENPTVFIILSALAPNYNCGDHTFVIDLYQLPTRRSDEGLLRRS